MVFMVTREDVENIALLSKLFVPEEELDSLTQSMQEIIDFADTINNAPTSGESFDNINNLFREDVVVESYDSEEILKNAPEQAESHFLVRGRE
jgi:aspartyl-tRNA(Asn)/glutamyl-tRNA(Gln) amidotransferase subunit C